MEALSSVTTIVTLANDITGAVNTVKQNKKKCQRLAERVGDIGEVIKELGDGSSSSSPSTAAATRRLVSQLEGALGSALLLVRSCQASSRPYRLVAGGWHSEQFNEVNVEIDRCLRDLTVALISRIERKLNAVGDTDTKVAAADTSICQTPPATRCSHGHDDGTKDDDKDKMATGAAEKNGALICYGVEDSKSKTGAATAGEGTVGVPARTVCVHQLSPPPPSYGYYLRYCHFTDGRTGGHYQQRGGHCHCAAGHGHNYSSYPWYSDSVDIRHMFSDDNPNSCSIT
uniref:Mixed lineage kinase domain-containing protein n=1 Tax=Oryza nivara TaxID=4536 RepID=A0A0E0HBU1_ORYNI